MCSFGTGPTVSIMGSCTPISSNLLCGAAEECDFICMMLIAVLTAHVLFIPCDVFLALGTVLGE